MPTSPTADDGPAVLPAALGFAQLGSRTPECDTFRAWLDSWPGIRWTATAMRAEQHEVLQLERTADVWTAMLP